MPWPVMGVSSRSFLAENQGAAGTTQIYLCTIGNRTVSATALLPASSRQITDIAVDPVGVVSCALSWRGDEFSCRAWSI